MTDKFDVVIVGAGLAGLQMLHEVREAGLTARVLEAGDGAGGTWYWNRYPGARCDVESLEYSYQFSPELQQDWEWTRRYAGRAEIMRYIGHVVDRFDLARDIRFRTRVEAMTYDEPTATWTVRADSGDEVVARFVIMATGCLSEPNVPDIPGVATFAGDVLHTGRWPREPVGFTGKRVGVVGTGSSGVQAIPIMAKAAAELVVFQRTPAYTLPAGDEPLDPALQAAIKADYAGFRARNNEMPTAGLSRFPANPNSVFLFSAKEREAIFEHCWNRGGPLLLRAFGDSLVDPAANEVVAEYVRGKIREIVTDPEVAAKLTPTHVIGCKRICLGDGYYETYNRPNVRLADIAAHPFEEVTPTSVRTGEGTYELDVLVFATGYDAITGALSRIDIRGRDGLALREAWSAGPRTYLGLGVPGFPNLFTMTGPGSPSVLTNVLVAIHQHATWIGRCLRHLAGNGIRTIEATPEAAEAWGHHVGDVAERTLLPSCGSWYLGANIPGKKRVFMPLVGFPDYAERCAAIAATGYPGFALAHDPVPATRS
ncbi:NAD(P)/FAD-dependent oxidoreductase [Amycolatopsis sp.]|uniref:flavin-containing monooxygenase n=1 Tax=Amycolatopsis sp. TaxID=37632 RepID=UPI002D7F72CB|nr:NAD(P)/FAD-dependent oxidoreductase [Amycolatopsis sp.]HET6704286.1 NAD(P)/FAD-dependent oxidoreductase [Amycolatopsis sp.]